MEQDISNPGEASAPTAPTLCSSCFMFFGNVAFDNLCSQCYKTLSSKNAPAATAPAPSPVQRSAEGSTVKPDRPVSSAREEVPEDSESTVAPISEDIAPVPPKPKQANPGRCWTCKKKVVFAKQVANKCRCDYIFCDSHRQSEQHECEFDHKTVGRDKLDKANPVVVAAKITRI